MEEWRDIEGYEGLYQVSNLGKVKRLVNKGCRKERILKPGINRCGYLYVDLHKYGKRQTYLIHRIVAAAFIDNQKGLPCINHKNEIKIDNRVDNLEFCTVSYNNTYNNRHEKIGEKLKGRKLLEETKQKISESLKGKKQSKECIEKRTKAKDGYGNKQRKQSYFYISINKTSW